MELRQYLFLIRRWAWLLILGLVLGGGGAYVASLYQQPVYRTATKVMVMRAPEDRGSEYSALNDYQLARTYSQLILTEPVLQAVSEQLGFGVKGSQISVRQVPDSQILDLTVEDGDPNNAARIANALVEVFINYNDSLQTNRFASSEESLKAQIAQVEEQIAGLQAEMNAISQESLQTQQVTIEGQVAALETEIATVRNEVNQLGSDPDLEEDAGKKAAFDEKQALLNQLLTRLNLYQQVYFNLTVLGETAGTSSQSLRMNQLQTTLALYQQIYSNLLNNYETVRLARLRSTPNIVQIEQAAVPARPVRPQPLRNSALGAATGLIIMGAIAFLIEYLDDTLRSPEDITRQLGLPVLGLIARHDAGEDKPIALLEPRSPVAEAFRTLRTNIQFAALDKPLKSILVTSPSPSEGKSTVAANLAIIMAQGDRRVVLLDTDLRRPKIHQLLGLPNAGGVSGVVLQLEVFLDGKVNLNGALQETGVSGLRALTSGKLPPNPAELLGSEKMNKALELIARHSDAIILDSPPVLAVTDASVLAPRVDGVILVIKPGETKLAAARGAVEQLHRVGATLLGVVLNDVNLKGSSYYHYQYKGYYYNYNGHYGEKTAEVKTSHKRLKVRSKAEKP